MATETLNLEKLVEELSNLKVIELANLKKRLEEVWGVTAAAPVQAVAAAPAAQAAEAAAESTHFEVVLAEVPADKKIPMIKVVRDLTGLGLKDAKEIVEGAPKVLKASATKAEAEEIVKKVQEAGAKATLKGL